jgi:signal transduction histidine kinase
VAASRLALDNARLVAGQRAALTEVRDSRTRLVVAADDERRRIQRDLHDGLQHDLLALSMLVQRAQAMLAADRAPTAELGLVARRLPEVVQDLRRLTEGIHPAALTEQGLAAALETLAERAPMPLIVNVVGGRWPESVERVAYFVVAEALANVYKHAQAGHARVDIVERSGRLVVSVADDGTGGADSQPGGGLSGLQDRVAAVAGSMHVASSSGGGTTIVAELPCG